MIELRFYSGRAYSAQGVWEDGQSIVSFGNDAEGKKISIVDFKRLGIYLIADDEEFRNKIEGQMRLTRQDPIIEKITLEFIFSNLTTEKFVEFVSQLAKDRYTFGHTEGKAEIQQKFRELLGIEENYFETDAMRENE